MKEEVSMRTDMTPKASGALRRPSGAQAPFALEIAVREKVIKDKSSCA